MGSKFSGFHPYLCNIILVRYFCVEEWKFVGGETGHRLFFFFFGWSQCNSGLHVWYSQVYNQLFHIYISLHIMQYTDIVFDIS